MEKWVRTMKFGNYVKTGLVMSQDSIQTEGRVCTNIVHVEPLPRGSVAPGFHSSSNKGWGKFGRKRGKSLRRSPNWEAICAEITSRYLTG